MLKLRQSGDTIVEVMIVLAVLGLAIGISYSTANRSLLNARQAQENSQATELAQSQVEQLRTQASNINSSDPNYIYRTTHLFCMNGGNVVPEPSLDPSDLSTLTNYSNYPAACTNSFYHISIRYSATDDKFIVESIWDDVLGQGNDTVTTSYRLHYISGTSPTGHVDVVCPDGSIVPSLSDCPPPPPINPSLFVSGGTGPRGAFYSTDTVRITIGGIKPGDSCTVRDDRGTTYLNACGGTFPASRLPLNSSDNLTAHVIDSGRSYPSNTVSVSTAALPCPYLFYQGTQYEYDLYSPNYPGWGYGNNVPPNCIPISL